MRPWSRASAHHGSDYHAPCSSGSRRTQFGDSGGNLLAPVVLEMGAGHLSHLTWRPSTSKVLPAPQGFAYRVWTSSATPCPTGGNAQGIFGAHTRAGAYGEVGNGLCCGSVGNGVSGDHGHGAEPLHCGRGRQGGERRSAKFLSGPKALRQERPSLHITTVI